LTVADKPVVFLISPEVAPFAKTGGLADVAGSLPSALRNLGVEVAVALPFYRLIKEANLSIREKIPKLEVPLGEEVLSCKVFEMKTAEGIPVYFFEREDLFDRPHLYGTPEGDYYDNLERFCFFSRAVLLFAKKAGFRFRVAHCHDWQTGLVPAYLRTVYHTDPFFSNTTTVFTIHNLGYQGLFPESKLPVTGIPEKEFNPEGVEYWGKISLLKTGMIYADAITTVSRKYSEEIRTPEFGQGMDGILRKREGALYGILNGVDYKAWNPLRDPHIPFNYDSGKVEAKKKNKAALIRELGLRVSGEEQPVLGMISRLSSQKGFDLVLQIAEDAVKLKALLVILGEGDELYQSALVDLSRKHGGNIAVRLGFDDSLAHRIMAGADMLLIPSLYEPCGLTQMYALKYGTVPIVRATGGLDDTIRPFDPAKKTGNGFKFGLYTAEALLGAIREAFTVFRNKEAWKTLMRKGMKEDFSWDQSARKYLEIYQALIRKKKGA
jgi:starch synthase